MIYDFALEPALVATWHDRRVGYLVLCQMGIGERRVPCAFPFPSWAKLVTAALRASIVDDVNRAQRQSAEKNLEVLLRHLQEIGTRRNGRLLDGETWVDAALREHIQYPFGGMVVGATCTATASHSHVVVASELSEREFPAWSPPAPPVVRSAAALGRALAPILRCAAQLRFVDPYFDPTDQAFLDPMKAYLQAAQTRRTVGGLRLQLHFGVRRDQVEQESRVAGRQLTELDVANQRLTQCEQRLGPLLQRGVSLRAFAWGRRGGGPKLHNRYVLTEVGGVAVQSGLDEAVRASGQTDDLTVLSKEQHKERWKEFDVGASVHRLIADRVIAPP